MTRLTDMTDIRMTSLLFECRRGPDYATQLLDLAKVLRPQRTVWSLGVAMARPSGLEKRITAMMNVSLNRRPLLRGPRVAICILALCVTIPIALLAQQAAATFSGSVADFVGEAWSGATITLSKPFGDETISTKSLDNGSFQLQNVPPGAYNLEVLLPGFVKFSDEVVLRSGENVERDFNLQLGSIEETVTVTTGDPEPVPTTADQATVERQTQGMTGWPLRPPIKLRNLNPAYPGELRNSGEEGQVILETLVTADGSVQVLNVLTPVDPDLLTPVQPALARAAVAAVRQWQYEATRLHDAPVDTRMTVTINFMTGT